MLSFYLDTKTQTEIIPDVVKNAISIVLKLNEKPSASGEIMKKLENIDLCGFEILFNESTSYIYH